MMSKSSALTTVFLAVLIDLMGFGIVLPLLPFYAARFNASPVAIGFLYSIYSLAQLVFSPLWGGLSDQIGRRPIMLMSTAGAVFAYILFALSPSLSLLFLSRLLAGMMGGNISTAQAYVADVTTDEDRARGMGLIGAAFGVGFVLGPALSTLLLHPASLKWFGVAAQNKFALPGFFAAFMSFVSFLLVLFKLPETAKKSEENSTRIVKSSVFTKTFWLGILEQKRDGRNIFPLLILSAFIFSFAQANLYSAFPLFCKSKLSLSVEQVGMQFVAMGLIAILIQGVWIKTLAGRFGEQKLFLTGSVLMLVGYVLIPFATSPRLLTFYLGVMAIGGSLNGPTLNSLISKEADPTASGRAMGISQGVASLGRVLGPAWGGFLFAISYQLPFLTTAIFLLMSIFVALNLQAVRAGNNQK